MMNAAIDNDRGEWADSRVEAYIDGLLPADERRAFEAVMAEDPALHETIDIARRLRGELRAIETPPCPVDVTERVLDVVRAEPGIFASLRERLRVTRNVWRPALLAAATVLLAIVLIRPGARAPEAEFTDAEVAEALAEVQWTLAYLNGVGSRTGQTIRHQVLAEGVVRPMQVGLGIVDSPAKSN